MQQRLTRYLIYGIILLAECTVVGYAQMPGKTMRQYRHVIKALCADTLQGREAGTVYEEQAGAMVSDWFSKVGFNPQIQKFTFRPADSTTTKNAANIYCYINNNADSTILISAHYDHLGMGSGRSRSLGKRGIHPGADDNASGVALLMGLAQRYKQWRQPTYNYILVSYAAHEPGLFGSAAFSNYCKEHFPPVCMALNFDMVGRMDARSHAVTIYSQPAIPDTTGEKLGPLVGGVVYTDEPERIFQTDCKTFAASGIRCLSLTTGLHEDYHKITDVPEKINYNGIAIMQAFAEKILQQYPEIIHIR